MKSKAKRMTKEELLIEINRLNHDEILQPERMGSYSMSKLRTLYARLLWPAVAAPIGETGGTTRDD